MNHNTAKIFSMAFMNTSLMAAQVSRSYLAGDPDEEEDETGDSAGGSVG
jgi:hypothetical protein